MRFPCVRARIICTIHPLHLVELQLFLFHVCVCVFPMYMYSRSVASSVHFSCFISEECGFSVHFSCFLSEKCASSLQCSLISPGKVREGYFCFPYMRFHTNIRILCFCFCSSFAVVSSICETGMHVLHSPLLPTFFYNDIQGPLYYNYNSQKIDVNFPRLYI